MIRWLSHKGVSSFLLIALAVFVGACTSEDDTGKKNGTQTGSRDSIRSKGPKKATAKGEKKKDEAVEKNGDNRGQASPIQPFLNLADTLAADGWKGDTARMNEQELYPGYAEAAIQSFGGRPFYRLEPESTRVLSGMGHRKAGDEEQLAVFREAEEVWGYFYRLDSAKTMIMDGAIEQWRFEGEEEAERALKSLQRVEHRPFFNTKPFYLLEGNYLFIFHARAMGFSYEQKPYFEQFKDLMKGYRPGSS